MPVPGTGELLRDNLSRRVTGPQHAWSNLAHPSRTLDGIRRGWPTWREFFAERRAPRTSLNHPISARRRLVTLGTPLERAKQIAHTHHVKINDLVLTAVAGGLRELLRSRGEDTDKLALRTMVPISLHREDPGRAMGNQDGWMVVPLPLGESDPAALLHLIAAETAAAKQDPSAVRQRDLPIRPRPARLPAALRPPAPDERHRHQRRGPTSAAVPRRRAAARTVPPVVSLVANLPLAVAALSYAGQLSITAVADQDSCGDVEVFAHSAQDTLDLLTMTVSTQRSAAEAAAARP
jgi:diacylglycerol O-acyltransferase / wax synthase